MAILAIDVDTCDICGTASPELIQITHCFVCDQRLLLCPTCKSAHSIRHSH